MWRLASCILLAVSFVVADPQQGYDFTPQEGYQYLPPPKTCPAKTSTVYSTSYATSVVVTSVIRTTTQYSTTTVYSQILSLITAYQPQTTTVVQYGTTYVPRETQVVREKIVTSTVYGRPIIQTQQYTYTKIVPQINYVTREKIATQVTPYEVVSTHYRTIFRDRIERKIVPVQRTVVQTIPGQTVIQTIYTTIVQSSIVQRPQPGRTIYRTTTLVDNQVETRTVPSPPIVSTRYITSERVIPTTIYSTQYQPVYVTRTQYTTLTQTLTQTKIQTEVVPQETRVTINVPRQVIKTDYTTQIVPATSVISSFVTINLPGQVTQVTKQAYVTNTVRIPGQVRIVSETVFQTSVRQDVTYRTQQVQQAITVTRTIDVPCLTTPTGYRYPKPDIPFTF